MISIREAVVVRIGAPAVPHLTELGQVMVREPVPSWKASSVSDRIAPADGLVRVIVQLLVSVNFCTLPLVRLSVIAAPELPASK